MANAALEIAKKRGITGVNEQPEKTQLRVVDVKPTPKGLTEIRGLFNSDRHTAEYVYTHLSKPQQVIVCYSAGLSKSDLERSYHQFECDKRLKIHQAILQLQEIVTAFVDANALTPSRFLQKRDFSIAKNTQKTEQAH